MLLFFISKDTATIVAFKIANGAFWCILVHCGAIINLLRFVYNCKHIAFANKKKAPEPKSRGRRQNKKLLQLVSRHSQTVCYINKRPLQTLAVDVAKVIGLAVVATAELMIKPAA